MYKIPIFSFAEWFYLTEHQAWYVNGLNNLASYKTQHIDPLLDKMLAYGADKNNTGFMTDEQKAELQKIRDDRSAETLFTAYNSAVPRQKLSMGTDLANPDIIKRNIDRMTGRFPLSSFKTLDDLLNAADKMKKSHRGKTDIRNLAQLINYLTTDRIVLAIENASRQAKSGGATADGDSSDNLDVDPESLDATEEGAYRLEELDALNKIADCMRVFQNEKSKQFIGKAKSKLQEIESKIDGKGKITWFDFTNAKKYALYSILGRFINAEYQTQDSKGMPSKNRLFGKENLTKFMDSDFNTINNIIKTPEFQKFLNQELNSAQPAEDAQLLQLSTLMADALLAVYQKPKDQKMSAVLEPYKQSSFAMSNPAFADYLEKIKDIYTNEKMAMKAVKPSEVVGPANLESAAANTDYPYFDDTYMVEKDFLYFKNLLSKLKANEKNPKKLADLMNLGFDKTGKPIVLNLATQSCPEIIDTFRRAGKI